MITSRPVTAEDAARYEDGPAALERVAGNQEGLAWPRVRFANGRTADMTPGQWVVRYAPGDVGVMDAGEWERYFGGLG